MGRFDDARLSFDGAGESKDPLLGVPGHGPGAAHRAYNGRQETWEDSPDGWPQSWGDAKNPQVWRTNGRPIVQWASIEAGRSDELT